MLAEILSKYKSGLSLLFTILFSLGSLIWQSNVISKGLNQVVTVLDFFTDTFHGISSGFGRIIDSYGTYENINTERLALREETQALKIKLLKLQTENDNLKRSVDHLNLPQVTEFPAIQAQVISQDPDNWFRTIIINKGSQDGIEPYMPVIAFQVDQTFKSKEQLEKEETENKKKKSKDKDASLFAELRNQGIVYGVVGKVIQVNSNSARIMPITDKNSFLGVLLKKTGHWAQVIGQNPYAEAPKIDRLSLSVFLKKGDEIITSGADGVFPRGLLVGYIDKKIERLGGFQNAEIRPALDLKRLDFVTIIQKKPDFAKNQFSNETLKQGEQAIIKKSKENQIDSKASQTFGQDPFKEEDKKEETITPPKKKKKAKLTKSKTPNKKSKKKKKKKKKIPNTEDEEIISLDNKDLKEIEPKKDIEPNKTDTKPKPKKIKKTEKKPPEGGLDELSP